MKLGFILSILIMGLAVQGKTQNKTKERKVAQAELNPALIIEALNKSHLADQSQKKVAAFTGESNYTCPVKVEKSEIKSVDLDLKSSTYQPSYKLQGTRLCFQLDGAGIVDINYSAVLIEKNNEWVVQKLDLILSPETQD